MMSSLEVISPVSWPPGFWSVAREGASPGLTRYKKVEGKPGEGVLKITATRSLISSPGVLSYQVPSLCSFPLGPSGQGWGQFATLPILSFISFLLPSLGEKSFCVHAPAASSLGGTLSGQNLLLPMASSWPTESECGVGKQGCLWGPIRDSIKVHENLGLSP